MRYTQIIQHFPPEWQTQLWELVEAIRGDMQEWVHRQDFEALTAVVGQLAEAQRQTAEQLRALTARVDALAAQVAALAAQVDALAAQVAALTARVDTLAEAQQQTEEHLGVLTARVDALAAQVDALAAQVAALTARVDALAEAQQRTTEQIQGLERRLRKVEDKLAKVDGRALETQYRERAAAYFGSLLRRVRVVDLPSLEEELEACLTPEEWEDLLWLDLVVRGRPRRWPEAPEVWLAVEISSVVDQEDVMRARRRADLLRRAGYPAIPVVAGTEMTIRAQEKAQEQKVALLLDGRVLLWWEEESLAAAHE